MLSLNGRHELLLLVLNAMKEVHMIMKKTWHKEQSKATACPCREIENPCYVVSEVDSKCEDLNFRLTVQENLSELSE